MLPNPTNLLTGLAALAAVLALVLLAGRVARLGGWNRRASSSGRRLRLEETLALDARRRVQLVRCDGRTLLLMTGGSTDLVLGWLPEREADPERVA